MGLFAYTLGGGGFILLGSWEAIVSSFETLNLPSPPSLQNQALPSRTKATSSYSSWVTFLAAFLLSFFFILNSLLSVIDSLNTKDNTGLALQLQVIAIASLFFLYSLLGLLPHFTNSIPFPSSILNLLCIFAFGEEFLLFYLQRKDPSGIENRYYDLFLVPVAVCTFSTFLELKNPKSKYARMVRAVGLILQGTWFVQMGFSFYSDLIAHGCSLHEKSRGNYTIRCKGHPEYHRGMAIATLQFNCHLAFLVVLITGVYSLVCNERGIRRDTMRYSPLGAKMQQLSSQAQFSLDTSDDEEEIEIKEDENAAIPKTILMVPHVVVNGHGSHQ